MKFKKSSTSLFALFTGMMVAFGFSACHLNGVQGKTTIHPGEVQTSRNRVDSGNCGEWAIFKTGQTRKHMTADDGDLRFGKPWPEPRFTENGDGTVTDRLSGLMWTRNADRADGKIDWEQAILGAGSCTDGGFTDWRVPNRNELESLIDLGRYGPALPEGNHFTGVQPSYYWTSTTPANNEDHAWVIHFYIGLVSHDDKAGSHYVWYVRGGR